MSGWRPQQGRVVRALQTDGHLIVVHAADHPTNTPHTDDPQEHDIVMFSAPLAADDAPINKGGFLNTIVYHVSVVDESAIVFCHGAIFRLGLRGKLTRIYADIIPLRHNIVHAGFVFDNLVYVQPTREYDGRENSVSGLYKNMSREKLIVRNMQNPIIDMRTSRRGGHIVVLDSDGSVVLVKVNRSLGIEYEMRVATGKVDAIDLQESALAFASGANVYSMRLVFADASKIFGVATFSNVVRQLSLNANGSHVAVACDDGVYVVNANGSGQVVVRDLVARAPVALIGVNLVVAISNTLNSRILPDVMKKLLFRLTSYQRR